jgi:Spy/CpxP family protein refolding chaperone
LIRGTLAPSKEGHAMRATWIVMGALALSGCGAGNTTGPTTPAPSASASAASEATPHHERTHGAGGVFAFLWMGLHELTLSADQKTAIDGVRKDLAAKMEPTHAAGRELGALLADGVMAGKVDRDKSDAAIDKLVAAVEAMQAAAADALNAIHKTLTPEQRAQLVDKMQARATEWHESHGDDEHDERRSRGQIGMLHGLDLTEDQRKAIRSNLQDTMKGAPPHDHKDMNDHLQAFAAAFKTDTFDAKTLDAGARRAATHVARWGATRLARFCEAAAPVLNADQRAKLAARLRESPEHEHGHGHDQGHDHDHDKK